MLTLEQLKFLKEHRKKHKKLKNFKTKEDLNLHMRILTKLMKKGFSFNEAHKIGAEFSPSPKQCIVTQYIFRCS